MSELIDPTPFYLKKRYLVIFLVFLGYVNLYTMRVNLSVAIVALTENRTIYNDDGSTSYEQYFDWSSQGKGFALGAFFYGYIITQIAGGVISSRIGGHWVFGFGTFGTAFMTLLTPIMLYSQGIKFLIASRIIQGIFSGLAFPSANAIYAKWTTPLERGRAASYGISGIYVGTVISNVLSGWIGKSFGWEWIFYVFGIVSILWNIIFFILVRNGPQEDPWMSQKEKNFIVESQKNQSGEKNVVKPPWKSIFTSIPLCAIAVTHFAYNWGYYTLLTQLPMYMRDILNFDLANSGFISAIPYIAQTLFIFVSGYLADWFLIKKILTRTQVRKYFNSSGCFLQMAFLLIAAFISNTYGIVACISLSVGFGAFAISAYMPNLIDIAPQFGSILLGISNTFATLPGLISPPLSGYIAKTPTAGEYRIIFFITCGIYIVGMVVHSLFSTAEVQPWALSKSSKNEEFKMNEEKKV